MDIKKGERLDYDGVECEVLWVYRPQGKAPTEVLLAEVVELVDEDEEPTGKFEYGERYRVTKAEALAGDPPAWYESIDLSNLSDEVRAGLEGLRADEVLEFDEAGLIKLKGIGKATAAKILEAAGE